MSTIVPTSEACKKALSWIEEERRHSEKPLAALLEEAAMRFNLGPNDCEFLRRFFAQEK